MMKLLIFLFTTLSFFNALSSELRYYKNIYGHLHLSPYAMSASQTAIHCGFPVEVLPDQDTKLKEWIKVKAGGDIGYIHDSFLSTVPAACFQDKYSLFVNALNLDLTDLYYWGRLFDQFISV
jgi:hypothetical protein